MATEPRKVTVYREESRNYEDQYGFKHTANFITETKELTYTDETYPYKYYTDVCNTPIAVDEDGNKFWRSVQTDYGPGCTTWGRMNPDNTVTEYDPKQKTWYENFSYENRPRWKRYDIMNEEFIFEDAQGRKWTIAMEQDFEDDNVKQFYTVTNSDTGEEVTIDGVSPYTDTWRVEIENFLDRM